MQAERLNLAALFIDLENFFLSRAQAEDAEQDAVYPFSRDLRTLQRALPDLAGNRRVSIKRAYADYTTGKPANAQKLNHLRNKVQTLFQFGVEAVQVFRPWGDAKNSVDMRMTVDALTLSDSQLPYGSIVLVSGDGDFVPLIQELKRRGLEVVVVGVAGAAARTIRKFADRFEFFKDLESKYRDEDLLRASDVLKDLMEHRHEVPMDELQREFERHMPHGWEPMDYQCPTLVEFLRQFDDVFDGKVVRSGAAYAVSRDREVHPHQPLSPSRGRRAPKPHSVKDYYLRLLEDHSDLRIHLVQERDWVAITDAIWRLLTNKSEDDSWQALQWVTRTASDRLENDVDGPVDEKVSAVLSQLTKSGSLRQRRETASRTRMISLDPGLSALEGIRMKNTRWVVRTLVERVEVEEREQIDPMVVAELFYGPRVSSQYAEQVRVFVRSAVDAAGSDGDSTADSLADVVVKPVAAPPGPAKTARERPRD